MDSGAFCFGLVIGWVCYRTLRRKEGTAALSDIATVIGAIGGGAVTSLFGEGNLFSSYSIGLAVGFFLYLAVSMVLMGKQVTEWMTTEGGPPL